VFENFEVNIKSEIKSFKETNPDTSNLDTVLVYEKIHSDYRFIDTKRFLDYNDRKYYYHTFIRNSLKYRSSRKKKLNFLENKIKDLGYDIELVRAKRMSLTKRDIKSKNRVNKKSSIVYDNIFRNNDAYYYYLDCIEYLGFEIDNKSKKRGLSGAADAIFRNEYFEDNIFKPSVYLKEYISFVCQQFKIRNIGKLSKPDKYEQYVSNFISDNKFKAENKLE